MRIAIKNDSMVAFLVKQAQNKGITPTMFINDLICKEMLNEAHKEESNGKQ